ncbi:MULTISPECIES: PH domain-containing protein [unclassified Rhodococcus (in: high G+C Gram-positive bacteria)]|uniref:PH domain-containing protein n=1 Tax=unclassified Rhodococcus (in: high G+C Gram-positive bacteria) TaxID=192944 RepID=UPI00146AABE7|nr:MULTISPECIES: PH domain-containing protein [unclassified Rhodococcus (in: high G+C Gram-positive bacteria)]NMD94502.1 PH domain-containing protein [Rhodococcus sp. BL-253-APC-6A1W]NME78365.1 PH domain-containing protein [Rhodococcus sp. 105337]
MGYPDDALAPGEELLLHRHPHWKALIVPAAILLVATPLAGFLLGVVAARLDGAAATVLSVAVVLLWLAVVVWRSLVPLVSWLSTHFIVTDRRVLVRTGVLTHTGIDIPMGRISNVQFRHGLVDRMLRTGTLVVVSAADDPLEFDDIPEVRQVHALLYQQAFDAHDRTAAENRPARHPHEEDTHRKAW